MHWATFNSLIFNISITKFFHFSIVSNRRQRKLKKNSPVSQQYRKNDVRIVYLVVFCLPPDIFDLNIIKVWNLIKIEYHNASYHYF